MNFQWMSCCNFIHVRFCSGNNTERIRMGRCNLKGQTVVDLYCGIGYYTLPFLVHGMASIVHAFEWNVNSVAALVSNLSRNRVSPERCVIHYGDNNNAVFGIAGSDTTQEATGVPGANSSLSFFDNIDGYVVRDVLHEAVCERNKWASTLTDIADRVCLGLLPSSRGGWKAAVNVLSRQGGIMHVHYNVNAEDIGGWVNNTCATFTELFDDAGKSMSVVCTHVEKVKSYAPRVYHIVVDITCTPLAPNIVL